MRPVKVYSKQKRRYVVMGHTEGNTLYVAKWEEQNPLVGIKGDRYGLDSGGLLEAQSRGVTRVVLWHDKVVVMDCPLALWLAAEEDDIGDGKQRFLKPQDIAQGEAAL